MLSRRLDFNEITSLPTRAFAGLDSLVELYLLMCRPSNLKHECSHMFQQFAEQYCQFYWNRRFRRSKSFQSTVRWYWVVTALYHATSYFELADGWATTSSLWFQVDYLLLLPMSRHCMNLMLDRDLVHFTNFCDSNLENNRISSLAPNAFSGLSSLPSLYVQYDVI